uniref:Uncharacterized protein n=2 Tax=Ixodes scapularis TaxID=6945 RepID=A0A1S4LU75_IXOSC
SAAPISRRHLRVAEGSTATPTPRQAIYSSPPPGVWSSPKDPRVLRAQEGTQDAPAGKTIQKRPNLPRTTSEPTPLFSSPRRVPGQPWSPSLLTATELVSPVVEQNFPPAVDRPPPGPPLPHSLVPQHRPPETLSPSTTSWLRPRFWPGFPCSNTPPPPQSDNNQSPNENKNLPTPMRSQRTVSYDTWRTTSPPSPLKRASADQ